MSEASGSCGLRSQTISHQNNNNINVVLILKSLILIWKNWSFLLFPRNVCNLRRILVLSRKRRLCNSLCHWFWNLKFIISILTILLLFYQLVWASDWRQQSCYSGAGGWWFDSHHGPWRVSRALRAGPITKPWCKWYKACIEKLSGEYQ